MTELIVKCPTCQRDVAWSSTQRYRPFCSERCRLIDLGLWAEEAYAIPAEHPTQHPEAD